MVDDEVEEAPSDDEQPIVEVVGPDTPVWLAFHGNVGIYQRDVLYSMDHALAVEYVNIGLAYWAEPS